MTLKASEGEGGGGMRTALSDLYLEHLLQKRSRPEVRGPRGVLGAGVRGRGSAPGRAARRRTCSVRGPGRGRPASEPSPRRLPGFVRGLQVRWVFPPPPQPFWVETRRGRGLYTALVKVKANFPVDGSQGDRKTLGNRPKKSGSACVLNCSRVWVRREGCKTQLCL